MTVNELRIGNIVAYKGIIIKVTALGTAGVVVGKDNKNASYSTPIEEVTPVLITRAILAKYGFQKAEPTDDYFEWVNIEDGEQIIYSDTGTMELQIAIQGGVRQTLHIDHVEYLHQLQNAFFTVANTELQLKK